MALVLQRMDGFFQDGVSGVMRGDEEAIERSGILVMFACHGIWILFAADVAALGSVRLNQVKARAAEPGIRFFAADASAREEQVEEDVFECFEHRRTVYFCMRGNESSLSIIHHHDSRN